MPVKVERFLIYARVSPKGSSFAASETSIPDQVHRCREYVRIMGGEVAAVVTDELRSADLDKLPGLHGVWRELEQGTAETWDHLIVVALDRILRGHTQFMLLADLLARHDKGLVMLRERFDCSTPTGRMMLRIFSSLAEYERELTRERTRAKMLQIARAGGWPAGMAPFGYQRGDKHDNTLQVNARAAEIVGDVFRRYAAGEGPAAIRRLHRLAPTTFWHMLRNPVYIGRLAYGGEDHPGKHPPIVDAATWAAAQRRLAGERLPGAPRMRPAAQTHPYVLGGLLFCSCGKAMTPYSSRGRGGRQYWYYRCADRDVCRSPTLPAVETEEAVFSGIRSRRLGKAAIRELVKQATAKRDELRSAMAPDLAMALQALREAQADKAKLDAVVLSGLLTPANAVEFNQRLQAARESVERLTARVSDLRMAMDDGLGPFADVERLAEDIARRQAECPGAGSPEVRRQYLLAHVTRIDVQAERTLRVTLASGDGKTISAEWRPDVYLVLPPPQRPAVRRSYAMPGGVPLPYSAVAKAPMAVASMKSMP